MVYWIVLTYCGHVFVSSWLCSCSFILVLHAVNIVYYDVSCCVGGNWCYDITIAYPWFDLLFKKVSHTVPSVLRYFDAAVVTLVVVEVVWLFLFDFRFFVLFFLSSLLVSSCGGRVRIYCLLYTIIFLVATLGDRTLSWVRFDWFVLITGITRTSCCSP